MNTGDIFSRSTQLQLPHYTNTVIQPAAVNRPVEGRWEAIPYPVRGGVDSGRLQDRHHVNVNMDDHGMEPVVPYGFPDAGPQGTATQEQPIAQGNQEYGLGYAPQHVGPELVQVQAYPFGNQMPAPDQPGAENIRRFASRYLLHPTSRVDMIRLEPDGAGGLKVVIVLRVSDIL